MKIISFQPFPYLHKYVPYLCKYFIVTGNLLFLTESEYNGCMSIAIKRLCRMTTEEFIYLEFIYLEFMT